jgi:uncharacterized OB-fold protein
MWQCSQQHDNREEARFCSKCGEKRETRVYCSECATLLEPEDLFCTSCGHRRDIESKRVSAPATVRATSVAATPIEAPAPRPAEVAVVEPADVAAPPKDSNAAEPVTFSFGGAKIPMGDNPKRPGPAVKTVPADAPTTRVGRLSSTQSMILGFVVSAALLGLAFYLITR